jgi:hypothetical protein
LFAKENKNYTGSENLLAKIPNYYVMKHFFPQAVRDSFIWGPNGIGALFGAVQLLLILTYPAKTGELVPFCSDFEAACELIYGLCVSVCEVSCVCMSGLFPK